MNKQYLILFLAILGAAGAAYFFFQSPSNRQRIALTPDQQADTKIFFDFAQEQLPIIEQIISDERKKRVKNEEEINKLQDKLNLYKAVTAIAHNDLKTLETMPKEALEFSDGQIWVSANKFKNNMDGLLASHIIAGENALFFVLYHAVLNTSDADDKNTLTMLKILLEKGLKTNAKCGEVFFVKNKPTDTSAADYIADYSLEEIAQAFPAAHDLLKQYRGNKKE